MRSSSVLRQDISVQTYLGTIAEGIHLASALRLFLWQREELHPAPLCGAQSSPTGARLWGGTLSAELSRRIQFCGVLRVCSAAESGLGGGVFRDVL